MRKFLSQMLELVTGYLNQTTNEQFVFLLMKILSAVIITVIVLIWQSK